MSAYGEPISAHSSVLSVSEVADSKEENSMHNGRSHKSGRRERSERDKPSKVKEIQPPEPIPDYPMDLQDLGDVDEGVTGLGDEFTDQQKEFVSELLDEKLTEQRDKLMNYFQNMQLEMIRQFQIQYLELADVIDSTIESKNRKRFINPFEKTGESDD